MGRLVRDDLRGIIPPLATPFDDREELDLETFRRELRFMLAAGVDGMTLTGSTGEGHTLTIEESVRLARVAVEEIGGRVPVISGVIGDSTREVIAFGRELKKVGVDALQITPVHYLDQPTEAGQLGFYDEIGRTVELPIVIYNVVPWDAISPETLLKLAAQEWVFAVKQSNGDIHKLADLVRACRRTGSPLRVLTAIDALLWPSYMLGAHGAVAATLTVIPELCVAQWRAHQRRDYDEAFALHERILPIWRILDTPDMPARLKCALELLGRPVGPARRPLLPVLPEVREAIRSTLAESGVLSEAVPA